MAHENMPQEQYKLYVREFARVRSGDLFMNSGVNDARIVLETLIASATKNLSIYSGSLNESVFSQESFDSLLAAKKISPEAIKIVVCREREKEWNQDLISFLQGNGVKIKKFQDTGGHIALADDCMFRFEYDDENKKAMCAFGSEDSKPKMIGQFTKAFDKIWQSAETVELTQA